MIDPRQSTDSPAPDRSSRWPHLLAVCLCFILSGVAALVYQIAWTRRFALVFGTSELAVAAVLAAYMGGLALGAWLIEKRIRRIRRPIHWYAGLEVAIALAALLLVPAGLWLAEQLLSLMLGNQPAPPAATAGGTSLFYLLAAFAILLVPTTLMGATLPLLARYAVHSEQQIGRRIGLLYACNAGGAAAGALLGSLLLLPALGLAKTTWTAVAINLAVAALALALNRQAADRVDNAAVTARPEVNSRFAGVRAGASPNWVLPLMLLSGAVSFLHEVLWTRMLGHVLGSSIQAFGVMLASFLAGIACGGGLGALLARRRERAANWLAISELAAGLAAVAAWYAMQRLSPEMESLPQRVGFGFALLFPLAFAIGLTYPLAVRVLARNVDEAAPASARVYSWNTVGAIVGAIAAGFLIVPALRYEGSVRLAVSASGLLACAAAFLLFRPRRVFGIAIAAAAVLVAVLFAPAQPDALLRYSPLRVSGKGEMLYYDVGRSAAVVTLRVGNLISIRTNGLPDAVIEMRGTSPQYYAEAWMTPLAVLARPQLQEMLIVGLGGGRVLEAIPPSVRRVDIIELEQKVIDANRQLANRRARDPLRDARFRFIVNDARGALQLTTKRYDAVISQPSHPWTAGASHLYTREFMQQARAHLNPGGLFVQWMNVDFLDESLLRSLVATLADVFPHVRLYRPAPHTLLFLASDAPIEPERQFAATRATLAAAPGHYASFGLNVVEDLIVGLAMDDAGSRAFAAGAPVITDDANRFAVASVFESDRRLSTAELGRLIAPHDPLLQPGRFVQRGAEPSPAFDYMARRIQAFVPFDDSARVRMQALAERIPAPYPELETQPLALQRAAQLAARGDWAGVAAQDSALAQVPWTSPWSDQALRSRIEWRVRSSNATSRSQLDAESIELIDRRNVLQPDAGLYLLRAMSAGNDPYVLMESLFHYALLILQGQAAVDDAARHQFDELRQRFEQLRFDDPVDQHHYLEVQSAVAAVAATLR